MLKNSYNDRVKFSRKVTLCLICLFVFTFKIAAAEIFIDKGFDRAQSISILKKLGADVHSSDAIKHIKVDSSLNLMGHVVAIFSGMNQSSNYWPKFMAVQNGIVLSLVTSTVQESIYKPPKA